jgi:hypothetical protein
MPSGPARVAQPGAGAGSLTVAVGSRFCQCMMGKPGSAVWTLAPFLLVAFVLAVIVVPMLLGWRREPPGHGDPDSDGGLGTDLPPRIPPDAPRDGLPLPDAEPARARLRDHQRLSDRLPRRARRPVREPRRTPARTSRLAT